MFERPSHLFVSSTDGALYDCRNPKWATEPALRPVFNKHFPRIETAEEFKACLRAGASTDLGGYPLYFVMKDGEPLSFESARKNLKTIFQAFEYSCDQVKDDWLPIGCEINYENSDMVCVHSGEPIPCACGGDSENEGGDV